MELNLSSDSTGLFRAFRPDCYFINAIFMSKASIVSINTVIELIYLMRDLFCVLIFNAREYEYRRTSAQILTTAAL